MDQQLCGHGTAEIIFVVQPQFFTKNLECLFNNLLGQDGLICDDVGWWSGFNKGGNDIDGVYIVFYNAVEGMRTNNYCVIDHGALIGYYIIATDGGRIP